MKKIRAKFRTDSVTETKWGNGEKSGEEVQATPVYSPDPTSENYSFSQATPNGHLRLFISNPNAFGAFEEGKEFYLDITPVDAS